MAIGKQESDRRLLEAQMAAKREDGAKEHSENMGRLIEMLTPSTKKRREVVHSDAEADSDKKRPGSLGDRYQGHV